MIPKKIYLNYVDENDSDKTWSEEPISVWDCDLQNREYIDLSQVWHDASEEPKDGSHILVRHKYMGDMELKSYHIDYDCVPWLRLKRIYFNGAECWAYVDDLLPKGGEQ